MGSFSDYTENAVLNYLFQGGLAANLYVALFTATPSDSGGGTEVIGGSYARKIVVANSTNFPNAVAGAIANGTTITFVTATAAWGTLNSFGVFDALTGGNLITWGALASSKTVGSGDTFSMPVGALTTTLD